MFSLESAGPSTRPDVKRGLNGGAHLEAHGEVLDLLVHVLLFLQGDRSFVQPARTQETVFYHDGF